MGEEALHRAVGQHLFASSPDPIFILDAAATVLRLNPAAAALIGGTERDLVGRSLGELFPSEAGTRLTSAVEGVLAVGTPYAEEEDATGASREHSIQRVEVGGREAVAVYTIRPSASGDPEPRYSELYERATDALFAVDRDGRMRALNHQAEELCGLSRDDVESVHFTEIVAEDEAERLGEYFADRVAGRDAPTQYEVRYRHASGEERWGEVHISRQPSAEGIFQASVRDITVRKRLELLRRDFLHIVSHDVKAPLGIIEGFATALQGCRYGPVSAKQAECLTSILQANRRVRHLMEQFLLAEEIDSERGLQGERTEAGAVLAAAFEGARSEAEAREIAFQATLPDLTGVWVEHGRGLQRILENLLSNALKFTDAGGTVAAKARPAEGGAGEGLEVEVHDTGRGIPNADLGRIFDRFYRGSTTAGTWGSGLGLYIVRRLVEISGGRITVESTPGEGARFSLWLPTAPAPRAAHAPIDSKEDPNVG